MRVLTFVLVLSLLSLVPLGSSHGGHDDAEQLVEDGDKLVVGAFTATQPGPLVVVPYLEAAPACGASAPDGVTLPLGADATVTFFVNASGLQAVFDVPTEAANGTLGLAIDTRTASRALILMQENAIALHALTSVVWHGVESDSATGVLGLPYLLPGQAHAHDFDFVPEGGGIVMAHDGSHRASATCEGPEAGHRGIVFSRAILPQSAGPGVLVHVVAFYDPVVADFLPRPIDGSTRILQANLYLMRPDEKVETVRQAFTPSWDALDALPLGLLAIGLAWAMRPAR